LLFCNEIKVFSLYVKFLHIFAINHFIQMLAKITPLIQLLRPKHWIKNVLLFAPLIFSGSLLKPKAILHAALGFLYFSIAASLVYTINDLADVERDRLHPVKRLKRPLASGAVSKQTAVGIIALFSLLSLTSVLFSLAFAWVLLGYIALNVAYSAYLKHQPVLDVFSVATGFVLRVYAGAVAIDVVLSNWMFITTLSLALYLASIKRLQELRLQGSASREVLQKYNVKVVERYADVSAVGAILFYSLYCLSEHPNLIPSIPLVLFGIFRYWYLVDAESQGESPVEVLYSDVPMMVVVLLWGGFILYEFLPKG